MRLCLLARWFAVAFVAGLASLPVGGRAQAASTNIADLWFAHNVVASMLGAGDRIKVTVCKPELYPWLYRMTPALAKAKVVPNGAPNTEMLLAEGVGLAFLSTDVPAEPLKAVGIDARPLSFNSLETMLTALDETASALGTDAARVKVADFKAYLEGASKRIQVRLADVPDDHRPRVLHLASLDPLQADGGSTIIDEWIRLSGGRNAADGLVGNLKAVSLEQILRWQPDVIIVSGSASQPLPGPSGGWEGVQAVRDGRVYRNPKGAFLWDRYSTEFSLEIQWVSKLLAPDRFADTDIAAEAKAFYRRFFGYEASDADIAAILAALPPKS